MIDTVIFDMDGVLIDTEPVYLDIIGKIYAQIGADVTREVHLSSLGVDSDTWWRFIIDEYDVKGYTPETLVALERSRISDFLSSPEAKEAFFEGIEKVLSTLKENGVKLAVASATHKPIVENVLKLGKIDRYFDAIVSASDPEIKQGKPAPDIFLHAAKLLDSDPKNCLVVEDSAHGLRAAKRAGMSAYAFLSAPAPISLDDADYAFSAYSAFFDGPVDVKSE